MSRPPCVIGKYCAEHEFVHGAEAEELRAKIEAFLKKLRAEIPEDIDFDTLDRELTKLLDETDARDSLAFVEVKPRKKVWSDQNKRAVRAVTKKKRKAKSAARN